MPTPRRIVLKAVAALGAAVAMPRAILAAGGAPGTSSAVFERVRTSLVDHFAADGYREMAPLPIVTGDDGFNGGLRYDDSHSMAAVDMMVVQPCARVSDIAEKGRTGVLPMFHIFRCDIHASEGPDAPMARALEALNAVGGLKPSRLGFVSVPELDALRPLLVRAGVDWDRQVFLRDPGSALEAGDGSGYFRHPGDDGLPALRTAGMYYFTGRGAATAGAYPLAPAWIEIGEVSINPDDNLGFGLGIERVAFASHGAVSTWEAQLKRLLARIDRDSAPGTSPPGRASFEKS